MPIKKKSDELAANRFNTIDLFLAFHKMLEKKKSRKVLETKITPDESTIDEKMATIQLEMQQRNAKKGRRFDSFSPITAKQKSLPLSWHY